MKSQYFVSEEMRCPDGTFYPEEWEADRLSVLFKVLDKIRSRYGGPIEIINGGGYRTPAFNQKLIEASKEKNGGVSNVAMNSQHIQGRAADIRPVFSNYHEIRLLVDMIESMHMVGELPELGGLGRYPDFVHVDIRSNNGKLTTWTAEAHGGER